MKIGTERNVRRSTFLTASLCATWLGAAAPDASWTQFNLSSGPVSITENGKYWITGSGNTITVGNNVDCDIGLENVTIEPNARVTPFTTGNGSQVRLTLSGANKFTANSSKGSTDGNLNDVCSAVRLGIDGASLSVVGGDGKLTAKGGRGGCGICVLAGASFTMDAPDATVEIPESGGMINLGSSQQDYVAAAGLGAFSDHSSGTVTVNAGCLRVTGGTQGAGIGVGARNERDCGVCGDVTINGGTVEATGGLWGCAIGGSTTRVGIGGSLNNYTQTGGKVILITSNAPALGGGIGGNTVNDSYPVARGGGVLGKISISGGELIAYSYANETFLQPYNMNKIFIPAIGGGGSRHDNYPNSVGGGQIEISGGTVVAVGIHAGIGSGGRHNKVSQGTYCGNTSVTITGGKVYAHGSLYAIGGPEQPASTVTNLNAVVAKNGCLITKGAVQVPPVAPAEGGEAEKMLIAADDYCPGFDFIAGDLVTVYEMNDDGSTNSVSTVAPNILGGAGGEKWRIISGCEYRWMTRVLKPGRHKLVYGQGDVVWCCIPQPGGSPVMHDIASSESLLLAAGSKAIVTGKYAGDKGKKNHFVAVMGNARNVEIVLNDLNVVNERFTIAALPNSSLSLRLEGANRVESKGVAQDNVMQSAIAVYEHSQLAIDGSGSLEAYADSFSAAIGASCQYNCGSITVNGGSILAAAGMQGAGIGCGMSSHNGSGLCGDIVVNGGIVRAYGYQLKDPAKGWAAGIGGASSTSFDGGSLKSYTQNGGDVEVYGSNAAGIGGGAAGQKDPDDSEKFIYTRSSGYCGPVKITGGRLLVAATNFSSRIVVGAGIGGGGTRITWDAPSYKGKIRGLASYEQTGGEVTVFGANVGIGGGSTGIYHTNDCYDENTTVRITGGTLTVAGETCAIGGMEAADLVKSLKSVIITGGSVKLAGGCQVAPSNALEQAVYPASMPMCRAGVVDPGTKSVEVAFTVGSGASAYTYAYSGTGHGNDKNLYFYLPDGRYPIRDVIGEMAGGLWKVYNGLKFVIR